MIMNELCSTLINKEEMDLKLRYFCQLIETDVSNCALLQRCLHQAHFQVQHPPDYYFLLCHLNARLTLYFQGRLIENHLGATELRLSDLQ